MVFLVNRYLAIFVLYKEEYKLKPISYEKDSKTAH